MIFELSLERDEHTRPDPQDEVVVTYLLNHIHDEWKHRSNFRMVVRYNPQDMQSGFYLHPEVLYRTEGFHPHFKPHLQEARLNSGSIEVKEREVWHSKITKVMLSKLEYTWDFCRDQWKYCLVQVPGHWRSPEYESRAIGLQEQMS